MKITRPVLTMLLICSTFISCQSSSNNGSDSLKAAKRSSALPQGQTVLNPSFAERLNDPDIFVPTPEMIAAVANYDTRRVEYAKYDSYRWQSMFLNDPFCTEPGCPRKQRAAEYGMEYTAARSASGYDSIYHRWETDEFWLQLKSTKGTFQIALEPKGIKRQTLSEEQVVSNIQEIVQKVIAYGDQIVGVSELQVSKKPYGYSGRFVLGRSLTAVYADSMKIRTDGHSFVFDIIKMGVGPVVVPPSAKIWFTPDNRPLDWPRYIRDGKIVSLPRVTGEDLMRLSQSKSKDNVEEMNLSGTKVTDEWLVHLKTLHNLRKLYLWNTQVSDVGLIHLKNLPLVVLNLSQTNVTDQGLAQLKDLPLKRLRLMRTKITDAGLIHIKNLSNLAYLDLSYTKLTDAGLVYLKGLPKLKTLDLRNANVTDAGLVHLKDCSGLAYLFLSDTQVTFSGIKHLKNLPLQRLDLSGTKVKDAGIIHLKELPNLTHLDLHRTQLTDAGVWEIKYAFPGILITGK